MSLETIGYFRKTSDFFSLASEALRNEGMLLISATLPIGENPEESVTGMKVFEVKDLLLDLQTSGFETVSVELYGGPAIQLVHKFRGYFRKAIKLETQKVEDSWEDPFNSEFSKFIYLLFNIFSFPLEYVGKIQGSSFSGVIILARKVS